MLKQLPIDASGMAKKQSCHSIQSVNPKRFRSDVNRRLFQLNKRMKQQGVHSSNIMNAAGFTYTNIDDTVRCETCELEVSQWTKDMMPFDIHAERSPTCSFVLSIRPNIPQSTVDNTQQASLLTEPDIMKQVRYRTFSHWSQRTAPSRAQMIEAGFFQCNVADRVICLYCNLICQQWTSSDDPCQVHRTLSPQCAYVKTMLIRHETSASIINDISDHSTDGQSSPTTNMDKSQVNGIVYMSACHVKYCEIPTRLASFATWSNDELPAVDDFVRAGFFYTGEKTIVTCFYCNGSLQNWGRDDNPTIEHARWFPYCVYAKQLCGDELYRKIERSKQATRDRAIQNDSDKNLSSNSPLRTIDDNTLSRLVAARLDLPISQSLRDRHFKLSVIKRCWEDQFRLKGDDFVSDCDLMVACTILHKQIEHIDGQKENITVPSIKMKKIQEKTLSSEEAASSSSEPVPTPSNSISADSPSQMSIKQSTAPVEKTAPAVDSSSSSNLCVLCWTEDKRLACLPCGHLATCVPCGHSLRTCPLCRQEIKAFVRIYI